VTSIARHLPLRLYAVVRRFVDVFDAVERLVELWIRECTVTRASPYATPSPDHWEKMIVRFPTRARGLRRRANRARQDVALDVASERDQVARSLRVAYANDVLFDDGPSSIRGSRSARCADEFHATLVGLVVGLSALEARQEGMVDVDRASMQVSAQFAREHCM